MFVDISYAHIEYSISAQNTIVPFHPEVFQGIVFILREARLKNMIANYGGSTN
jgi:hypothetical protein